MNLPNLLSLLRLVMVPVFAMVFFRDDPNAHYWAAGVYALAFFTDIADGWIARHFNQITRLGRILDPLADKLMTLTVILCITIAGIIPVWAVVVFFLKELLMGIGALVMYRRMDDVISSNWLGKASTGGFFVVCAALVLFPQIPSTWATVLISCALALTIAALISYVVQYLQVCSHKRELP
ncbi:CDP-diacylglycerol--glycerol-3-phosphate 3-phosphatidyltransferase [Pseudoflavonifractor phocaeensis]|uniref:CDP-diacylglycerol--glycerol-3-phosphate 3-phosphatidyltransferase n=1 Tax=Pseudoflavonifractor phocaeensis TaxID=1870988 RepID=UPI001956CB61|nr:CDP-diacylglycerol--glycerol-3-phosphate 3-phosphatidyltransferase [Pseudoflavonifractor phocaeensis]MBM6937030.1 CDP-diacylglycerol--glycerol-3-phosphate 3-phosphatidyltransferase [Pseudoflavonifractor phocaeensis]